MSNFISPFLEQFNVKLDQLALFRFITRDTKLQQDACDELEGLLSDIGNEKQSAIALGQEDYSNILLGCECVASAVLAEIKMSLFLKQQRPDDAWNSLIAAQGKLSDALRAHEGFSHVELHIQRLAAIERLVFPPQVFLSAGMIVMSQECSVCGVEYQDCSHVKGRPYMGSFCTVSLTPSSIDHVAIVDNPADKRCRVLVFTAAGGKRNLMTWRIEPDETGHSDRSDDRSASAVIATKSTFVD